MYNGQRIIPYIGSGFTLHTGFLPSWQACLLALLQAKKTQLGQQRMDEIAELLKLHDYETAQTALVAALGQQTFVDHITQTFTRSEYELPKLLQDKLKSFYQTFTGPWITTNIDQCLEKDHPYGGEGLAKVVGYQDPQFAVSLAALDNRNLWFKLNGDIDDPLSLLLTDEQGEQLFTVDQQLDWQQPITQAFAQLYRKYSLVFIGCSMSMDWPLRILEALAATDDIQPQFAILLTKHWSGEQYQQRREQLEHCNIKPIFLEQFEQLPQLFDYLRACTFKCMMKPLPVQRIERQSLVQQLFEQINPDKWSWLGRFKPSPTRMLQVIGKPGVGKSIIARQVLAMCRERYHQHFDFILEIIVEDLNIIQFATSLSKLLNTKQSDKIRLAFDSDIVAKKYIEQQFNQNRLLILLDNVLDANQVLQWLPAQCGSSLLITSYDHQLLLISLVQRENIEQCLFVIECFTTEETLNLCQIILADRYQVEDQPIYLDFARSLDFLPLTLGMVLPLLKLLPRSQWQDLLTDLQMIATTGSSTMPDEPGIEPQQRQIQQLFEVAVDYLQPCLIRWLALIAVCNKGRTSESFLLAFNQYLAANLPSAAIYDEMSHQHLIEQLAVLVNYGWLERITIQQQSHYQLHPITQAVIFQHLVEQQPMIPNLPQQFVDFVHEVFNITDSCFETAARFRVYGYDAQGNVVAEIQQSSNTSIEWSVHVANRKAQWYEFDMAMDLPESADVNVPLRNKNVTGGDRRSLAIDPGEKKIMGLNMDDSSYALVGNFQGTSVTLGELRTDSVGRLVFLPGHGVSGSLSNKPVYRPEIPTSFNNAAGWYDDICDGPVHAVVKLGEQIFDADPAWVASAPPNFAPDVVGWRNMDDLVREVYYQSGLLALPKKVSFMQDVYPILQRLTGLQWVNKGLQALFGAGSLLNFEKVETIEPLAKAPDPKHPDPYIEMRRNIYNRFRATIDRFSSPDSTSNTVQAMDWPQIYGDLYGTNVSPNANVAATFLQLPESFDYILRQWVNGDFIGDFDQNALQRQCLQQIPLQQQPEMLDRANLHFCLADAFHPGCELTWPMRHASMYRAPYRIREREAGVVQPTYGSNLDQTTVLAFGGPLFAQGGGDLTRWMALPWQGDTAFCRSGYKLEFDPYMPTFWPARVPNQVLTQIDYEILMNKNENHEVRIAAFQNRPSWLRQLPANGSGVDSMLYMIHHFGEMGILEARPRPDDMDWLPEYLYVETLTETKQAELEAAYEIFRQNYSQLGVTDRLLQEAGWFNEEHLNEFATIKRL